MCTIIVLAIFGFAVTLGEPIHLDLVRSQSDYQLIADYLGQGYVAGTDLIMNDPPGTDTERAETVC